MVRTLHGVPKCRDGGVVLVHGDGESVHFVVVLHVEERVVARIAVEVDVRPGAQLDRKGE